MDPSSKLLGIPIAFFGVGAYLTMIVLLIQGAGCRRARVAWIALPGVGTLVSAGLLYYAHTVIQAVCWWCVASGIAMTVLLVLGVVLLKTGNRIPPVRSGVILSLAGITAIALGVQAGLMQRAALKPPISAERLAGIATAELIDLRKSIGPTNASVTIIEFGDFACLACRTTYAALAKYHNANPRGIQLVFRHLPLFQIRGHELSRAAAAASEMAAERGKFWAFANAAYGQRRLDRAGLLEVMKGFGFDATSVETRLGNPGDAAIARVLRDETLAERLGINQTPTFIVLVKGHGPIAANQRTLPRVLNSEVVQSAVGQASFHSATRQAERH